MILSLLLACHAPATAPAELDDLMAYLFEHAADPDDALLVEAGTNLSTWMEYHLEATVEGYQVHNLSESTILAVEDELPDMDHLVGAAVGHESPWPAETLGSANAVPPGTDTSTWGTEGEGRVYRSDPVCFAAGTCPRLTSEEWAFDELPLLINAETHWSQEWRWVETEAGPMMLQRWWILEPIDFSVDFLAVDHQYYVWAFLPRADGTSVSVQAVWIAATLTGAPLPEASAMNMVVGTMGDTAERLDERVAAAQGE